jgi:hypothetical protein
VNEKLEIVTLRARLQAALEKDSIRAVARASGVSRFAVAAFLRGATPRELTLKKLRAWANRPPSEGDLLRRLADDLRGLFPQLGEGQVKRILRLVLELAGQAETRFHPKKRRSAHLARVKRAKRHLSR